MDPLTLIYLVVGGLSLVVLLVSVVIGDVGHLAADADGPFSLPAVAAFFGGGGFAGAIAAALTEQLSDAVRLAISLGVAVAVAVPLAWGVVRLVGSLMRLRTDETITGASILGTQGTVVTPISSPASFGEVRLNVGGHTLKYNARAQRALPVGTPVYVVDVLSETSVEVVSTAYESALPAAPEN